MEIKQAIEFLRHRSLSTEPMIWADLGAGKGLFTHALAQILVPGSKVLAVDKEGTKLNGSGTRVEIEVMQADFTAKTFNLDNLDGILMANSLHFVAEKNAFIERCLQYFKQDPCFIIIEYDLSVSNPWVPFPIAFASLRRLLTSIGLSSVEKIHEAPSKFNRSNIYSVIARK